MRRAPSVLATVRNSEAATSILAMNWLRRAISTFGEANTSSPNVNPRVDFSGCGRAFLRGDCMFYRNHSAEHNQLAGLRRTIRVRLNHQRNEKTNANLD